MRIEILSHLAARLAPICTGIYFFNLSVFTKAFPSFSSGHHYLHKDESSDNMTADTIESAFKELHSEVDAVFSHDGHLYMIKVTSAAT